MFEASPYKAYSDDSILNSSPVELVVALYEGAIEASVKARECLAAKDIPGRSRQIKKIINILTELTLRLDDAKGGDFSRNLRRLYAYIQGRVTEANIKQIPGPLEEVEKLLGTVLEGWREVCYRTPVASHSLETVSSASTTESAEAAWDAPSSPYEQQYFESAPAGSFRAF